MLVRLTQIISSEKEELQMNKQSNTTPLSVLCSALTAFAALVINGLGVYLTIHADIGAGPWDVLNLGLSHTFGILYGNASITVSVIILLIDIWMKEPIGLAMFIDAFTVGKAVDFFDRMNFIPRAASLPGSIAMMLVGLTVMGYTQFLYMRSALGCGPRDTLLVGLAKIFRRIPIGAVSIAMLSMATFVGWLLGGPVGIGTLICAFCAGPIMQFAFRTVHFNATEVRHQRLSDSAKVFTGKVSG